MRFRAKVTATAVLTKALLVVLAQPHEEATHPWSKVSLFTYPGGDPEVALWLLPDQLWWDSYWRVVGERELLQVPGIPYLQPSASGN